METVGRGQDRVVALIDMDCFYVQVEQKSDPELRGKPCAVAQYKTWQGGGIIAVSYEARAYGVTRGMRGVEAKKKCPQLLLARIPEAHGKADLSKYREASVQVIAVMSRFAVIERASIDEAYVDLTAAARQRVRQIQGQRLDRSLLKTTFVEGFTQHHPVQQSGDPAAQREEQRRAGIEAWLDSLPGHCDQDSPDLQLTAGALIVEEMRAAVEAETGYRCSAGISHNKVLAKLSCGLNKPNRQTLLPMCSVTGLFDTLPIGKMSWLFDLCRGVEFEPVRARQLPKSIGCSKNFLGTEALSSCEQVKHWLLQLATELEERLNKDREQNQRVGKLLSVVVRLEGAGKSTSFSRCCALSQYQSQRIAKDALSLIKGFNRAASHQAAWFPAVTSLCLATSKFSEPFPTSAMRISQFLSDDGRSRQAASRSSPSQAEGGAGAEGAPSGKVAQGSAGHRKPGAGTIASYFQRVRSCPDATTTPVTGLSSLKGHVTTGQSFPMRPSFFKSKALVGSPLEESHRVHFPETPGSPLAESHRVHFPETPGSPLAASHRVHFPETPGSPLAESHRVHFPETPGSPLAESHRVHFPETPGSPLAESHRVHFPETPGSPLAESHRVHFPETPGSPLAESHRVHFPETPGSPLAESHRVHTPETPGSPLAESHRVHFPETPGSPLAESHRVHFPETPGSPLAESHRVHTLETPGSPLEEPQSLPQPWPSSAALSPELLLRCVKCGEHKAPWEMPEHEDFHFALDLQKSLSAPPSPPPSPQAPASSTGCLKKKAARQLVPGGKRPRVSSERTLDSYFKINQN
ncbi:DNA polymerase eta isoform X2 [Carcharodon carcharias]|uniref:DNA polymerase eta isoform X2 n=1 Tax=Carcharodon carcharias TaxID=13397 RepID=UPI001B7ED9D9|nr:DNA polymerase eta isoform X2 [Carcharodon carcharias]